MALRRTTLFRIVALIIAAALASQGAGAQVVGCSMDGGRRAVGEHSAMSHTQHGDSVSAATTPDDSGGPTSRPDSPCMQTLACSSAPALVSVSPTIPEGVHPFAPIVFTTASLEARSLRPDSPPPKL